MDIKEYVLSLNHGNVKDKDKLKKVLVALIRELKQTKYKTELIKLSYILDYLYCKENREKIGPTTVEYIKYNYGPYSDSFIDAFGELIQEGVIVEGQLPYGVGYSLIKDTKQEIDEKTKKILRIIIEKYGHKTLRELKEFIYQTDEFKDTEFGKPILLPVFLQCQE